MSGTIPPLPNMPSRRGAELKKHRDNFTFTFITEVLGIIEFSRYWGHNVKV
jgi:hypothetical protein